MSNRQPTQADLALVFSPWLLALWRVSEKPGLQTAQKNPGGEARATSIAGASMSVGAKRSGATRHWNVFLQVG